MKNYFYSFLALAGVFLMSSCSSNDDGPETTFEQLVISEIDFPESFNLGELYEIPVTYQLPDGCTEFYQLNVGSPAQDVREIVAIGTRTDTGGCTQAITEGTETLVFQVLFDQPYTFRFYQGDDNNGDPIITEVEVPVTE